MFRPKSMLSRLFALVIAADFSGISDDDKLLVQWKTCCEPVEE